MPLHERLKIAMGVNGVRARELARRTALVGHAAIG